jgi:hypothetical protein
VPGTASTVILIFLLSKNNYNILYSLAHIILEVISKRKANYQIRPVSF